MPYNATIGDARDPFAWPNHLALFATYIQKVCVCLVVCDSRESSTLHEASISTDACCAGCTWVEVSVQLEEHTLSLSVALRTSVEFARGA